MVSHLWQKFADYSSISSNIYIYIDTVFQYAFNSSTLLQFLIYLEYFSAAYYCYVNPPRLLYERSRTMWPKSLCGNILFAWKRYTKKMKNSICHKYWQPLQQLLVMITKTNGSSLTYMQANDANAWKILSNESCALQCSPVLIWPHLLSAVCAVWLFNYNKQ